MKRTQILIEANLPTNPEEIAEMHTVAIELVLKLQGSNMSMAVAIALAMKQSPDFKKLILEGIKHAMDLPEMATEGEKHFHKVYKNGEEPTDN